MATNQCYRYREAKKDGKDTSKILRTGETSESLKAEAEDHARKTSEGIKRKKQGDQNDGNGGDG